MAIFPASRPVPGSGSPGPDYSRDVCAGNDLAVAEAHRAEYQRQRVSTRGDCYRVPDAAEAGKLPLECLYLGTEDELSAAQNLTLQGRQVLALTCCREGGAHHV